MKTATCVCRNDPLLEWSDSMIQGIVIEQKLDLRNTAIKFVLDQTLGAAVNTALFLFLIKLLRGGSLESCFGNVGKVSLNRYSFVKRYMTLKMR